MPRNVYVVDIETTGLMGQLAGDAVVEVGIARVDLDTKKVYAEYGAVVRQILTPAQADSWVFHNTDLTPAEVRTSPYSICDVTRVLRTRFSGSIPVTSYNRVFDIDLFLSQPPYLWRPNLAPCIKVSVGNYLSSDGRWISAQAAYNQLCPDNPAKLPFAREEHRALSDAVMEGYILLALCEKSPDFDNIYDDAIRAAEIAYNCGSEDEGAEDVDG